MRARFWLPALVLAAVVLTGCLTNPITGRMGPSWDVPVEVPLISGEVTVDELAADYLEEYLPEAYNPEEPLIVEFSETVEVDVSELGEAADLPFDDFSVEMTISHSELVDEVSSIEMPLADVALNVPGMTATVEIPVLNFLTNLEETEELDLDFESALLSAGELVIQIENTSDAVLKGLKLSISGIDGAEWDDFGDFAKGTAERSLPLTGEVEGPFEITFEVEGVEGPSGGELIASVELKDLEAEHVIGLAQDDAITFEFTASFEGLGYDEITFTDGTFELILALLEDGEVEIDSVKAAGSDRDFINDGLAGLTLVEGTTVTVEGSIVPTGGIISTLAQAERSAEAELTGVEIKGVKRSTGFDPVEISESIADWDLNFDFTSLTIAEGELTFTITGLSKGEMEVVGVIIDDQELEATGSGFSLAGIVLARDSEIRLTGAIADTEIEFEGAELTAQVQFTDLELDEIALVLEKQEIDASELDIEPVSLSFDWGEYGDLFDWIAGIENEVLVVVENPSGIPLDLAGLDLKFTGSDGGEHIISLQDAEESRMGDVTTYTIKSADFVEIFRSEPQKVELDGHFVVGSDEDVLIDPNTVITITVRATAQAVLAINYDAEFEDFVLQAREVAQQAEFDEALEFMSQPGLFAEVTNGIPLGVQICLELSTSEDDWEDAVQIDLGIIPAAETDAKGRAVKPQSGLLELPVDDEVQDFLRQGGFVRMCIALASEGQTGIKEIAITPSDAVEYRIWAVVGIKINQ